MAAYQTSCPNCGAQLAPVALDPDTASWLCAHCALGWWTAELGAEARAAWRPQHRDFGHGPLARDIRAACHRERTEARTRGTSARLDQLALLDKATLDGLAKRLANRPGIEAFVAAVEAAVKARSATP